jgi:hypothetical protein
MTANTNHGACSLLAQYASILVEACRTHSPATAAVAYDLLTTAVGRVFVGRRDEHPPASPDPNVIDRLATCLGLARNVGREELGVDPGQLHYELRLEAGWLHEEPASQVWLVSVRSIHGAPVRSYADEDSLCALGKLCTEIERAHEARRSARTK